MLRPNEILLNTFISFLLFLFILKPAFSAEDEVGKIENVIGQCEISSDGQITPIVKNMSIREKDKIITKEKALVKIIFFDGSDIILYENSELNVQDYKLKVAEDKKNLKSVISDIKGKIRFFVKPDPDINNDTKFKTNNAVMGIRGTGGFIVAPEGAKTQLVVTEGKVTLSNPATPDKVVEVKKDEWGQIEGNDPPAPPKPTTPELIKALDVTVPAGFELSPSGGDEVNKEKGDVKSGMPAVPPPTPLGDKDEDENKEEPKEDNAKEESDSQNNTPTPETAADDDNEVFRIGPIVSAGFYNFISIGIEAKFFKTLGASISFGGGGDFNLKNFPDFEKKTGINYQKNTNIPINDLRASLNHVEVRGLLYPFSGSFFVGAALGRKKIDVKAHGCAYISGTTMSGCNPVEAFLKMNLDYVTPQLGWLFVWKSGFTIGTEIGAQIPLRVYNQSFNSSINTQDSTSYSVILNSSSYSEFNDIVKNRTANYFKENVLPFWNVLKIGWLF